MNFIELVLGSNGAAAVGGEASKELEEMDRLCQELASQGCAVEG